MIPDMLQDITDPNQTKNGVKNDMIRALDFAVVRKRQFYPYSVTSLAY